jgi:selenocysteine lyase/cysteine desulfurase
MNFTQSKPIVFLSTLEHNSVLILTRELAGEVVEINLDDKGEFDYKQLET